MTEWRRPRHLREALELLGESPDRYRIVAGGTDVMVERHLHPENAPAGWLDISGLSELRGIARLETGELRVGAMTPLSAVREDAAVRESWPLLAASAAVTGAPAIQNRATLGGNICNASPAADNPPVLLAYGAEIEIASAGGVRRIPYSAFHAGYRRTVLGQGEMVTGLWLKPVPRGSRQYFRKVGTRAAQAITKVGLAAVVPFGPDGTVRGARFGFSSVAETPCLARTTAAALEGRSPLAVPSGEIGALLEQDIAPISDLRSTGAYRRQVAARLVREALQAGHFQ